MMPKTVFLVVCICLMVLPGSAPGQSMSLCGKEAIQDCAGRYVRIEAPFSRIISLYPAHTENLLEMGAGNALIGISDAGCIPGRKLQKPEFSSHDGPERFLAADPELLLVRPMIDRGCAGLIRRLEEFGVCVVSLQPRNVAQMQTYWRILGRLAGRKEAAAEMIRRFHAGVSAAEAATEAISPKTGVYFESIHEQFKTFSPGSMPLFALARAGGRNVAGDARPVRGTNIAAYGKERILSHAEEIAVYLAQKGVMNRITRRDILQEPGFQVIRAVRKEEVYLVAEETVSRPTLRILRGICRIGQILYPRRFDAATREEILFPQPQKQGRKP